MELRFGCTMAEPIRGTHLYADGELLADNAALAPLRGLHVHPQPPAALRSLPRQRHLARLGGDVTCAAESAPVKFPTAETVNSPVVVLS